MAQPATRSTSRLYPGPTVHAFLQADPTRLHHLRATGVVHQTYGEGLVTRIEHRPGDPPLLHVTFPTTTRPRRFRLDALAQDRLTAAEVPSSLLADFTSWLPDHQARDQRRLADIHTRQRRQEEARQRRRHAEEQADRVRRAACRARAAERERYQKELMGIQLLLRKYRARTSGLASVADVARLGALLQRLERRETLSRDDLAWLEARKLHGPLAAEALRAYVRTHDEWKLARASRHLRLLGKPDEAIERTHRILEEPPRDRAARAALLTSVAAAHRDLDELAAALTLAEHALELSPDSSHLHELLAALYQQDGDPLRAQHHRTHAAELSAR